MASIEFARINGSSCTNRLCVLFDFLCHIAVLGDCSIRVVATRNYIVLLTDEQQQVGEERDHEHCDEDIDVCCKRPQGVYHAYGPGSMFPEQLKLSIARKRKKSQSWCYTRSTSISKAQTGKLADARMASAALGRAFKCSVLECQHHYQGFATQNVLDKHIAEIRVSWAK
ncbi:uncharacterized protein AKAW2_51004A [Aspergillus luchuensis]|uniref:Uncharacterized protein n=1 Tax=Aspergillus kawachii TaxID=1069201 RepID=A0A7R7WCY3_ASPKA|nr:uncharacterized protein AKAW2_51004A [Aspergillus luchuensis]BCS00663.1 hypothetical protein AKAW2_51004A [Aspergillus luchuensis]